MVDTDSKFFKVLKMSRYFWSTLLIGFSGFIIVYGILANESHFNRTFPDCPPVASFFIFWALIIFFGLLEGAHVCVVDLSKHSTATFRDNYPSAAATQRWVSGNRIFNLSRFLMGRQVMVIFNQFFLGALASFPGMYAFPFTDKLFPEVFKNIMVDTGLLNVCFVTTFGSLVPQLIATRYPVQFMNLLPIKIIVAVGLAIEASGIAHFSWVLHDLIAYILKMDINVTRRVMAADEGEEIEINVNPEREDFTKTVVNATDVNGRWKNEDEIAKEWFTSGCNIPLCLSQTSSVNMEQTIQQLYAIMKRDQNLAATADQILFA